MQDSDFFLKDRPVLATEAPEASGDSSGGNSTDTNNTVLKRKRRSFPSMAKAVSKVLPMTFNESMDGCWNGACDYAGFKNQRANLVAAIITYAFDKRRFNTYSSDSKSNIKYSGIDEKDTFEKIYGTSHVRYYTRL